MENILPTYSTFSKEMRLTGTAFTSLNTPFAALVSRIFALTYTRLEDLTHNHRITSLEMTYKII